jgi:hypothetical protein
MEDGFALARLLGFDAGWIAAPALCNLATAKLFYDACRMRDIDMISRYSIELSAITDRMLKFVGGEGHMDGAYDKLFAKMNTPAFPLRLLPPYSYPSDECLRRFVCFLIDKYPHWAPHQHARADLGIGAVSEGDAAVSHEE